MFDQEGSGFIDPRELKLAMRALGLQIHRQQLMSFLNDTRADTTSITKSHEVHSEVWVGTDAVSFEDFAGFVAGRLVLLLHN